MKKWISSKNNIIFGPRKINSKNLESKTNINSKCNTKSLNMNNKKNNAILEKYIKKKVTHYIGLNKNINEAKSNSKNFGIKNISRNINNLYFHDNKQNLKFKSTSEINNIYE